MENFDMTSPVQVRVESDLADLIPNFVQNRKKDMVLLGTHIQDENYDEISRLGHTLKGICAPYGFELLGDLARDLEVAAKNKDQQALQTIHKKMNFIVDNHEIEYEES